MDPITEFFNNLPLYMYSYIIMAIIPYLTDDWRILVFDTIMCISITVFCILNGIH